MKKAETKIYNLEAAGRPIGRLASEAAALLRGKREVSFQPNQIPDVKVKISNADQAIFTGDKTRSKVYSRYSGWPGGLKQEKADSLIRRRGRIELLRRAITRMLPRNKLRRQILQNLEINH